MFVPLHLGFNHIGPVLIVMAAGAILWSVIWYLLRSSDFGPRGA